jgi:membrane protein
VTRGVSDKLIRAGILNLAGQHGDRLVPGRALDMISVRDVLDAVRADEDGIVRRLPAVLPEGLKGLRHEVPELTFAQLVTQQER